MRADDLHTSISMFACRHEILTFESRFGIIDTRCSRPEHFTIPWRLLDSGAQSFRQKFWKWPRMHRSTPQTLQVSQAKKKKKTSASVILELADSVSIVLGLRSLATMMIFHSGQVKASEECVIVTGTGIGALKEMIFHAQMHHLWSQRSLACGLFGYRMAHQFLPVGIHHLLAPTLTYITIFVASNYRALALAPPLHSSPPATTYSSPEIAETMANFAALVNNDLFVQLG